jgi:hypothetical protein
VYTAELARRRRQHAQRQAANHGRAAPGYASEAEATSAADDAWKDQLIIVVGLAVRTVIFLSSHCDSPITVPCLTRSQLWWALPLRCYHYILSLMRGIVLHPPTLRRHEQKHGHLEMSGVPRSAPASPSLGVARGTRILRHSTYLNYLTLTHTTLDYCICTVNFSSLLVPSFSETIRTDAPVPELVHQNSTSAL